MSSNVTNSRSISPPRGERMRLELDEILRNRHEKIFFRMNRTRVPCRAIECGDGWFPLLNHLCASLQERTDLDGAPQLLLKEINTVNGRLQFEDYGSTDVVHQALIRFAKALSMQTCECCGAPGTLVKWGSSLHARCNFHSGKPLTQDVPHEDD